MNSKLINTILLALSFVAAVIGVHRSIEEKQVASNYWIFMIGFILFALYMYRKKKDAA